MMLIVRALIRL